ncbi:sugar ABC transporter ATP-binding protein [Tessaracoccus sp. HDW20]|uniref:ATP-binding cassette domain-containing protein n=1 Tax=Tessaracoccus coleopterorum TaxID=2714950 RepID=UPI0018D2D67E|nr:sugar ABC transporter ATP-binding protein [Tessaracoccus coleopterorum]
MLGIAGLLGSGRTELLESIFGTRRDATGTVRVNGREMTHRTPGRMLAVGVAMTTEDRKRTGIVPILSVAENMMLTARSRVIGRTLIDVFKERASVADLIARLRIRASSGRQPIGTLSGGNQQKAVIGRCLASEMRVLLLDEPTRGVDVDAKGQIYELIRELATAGVSSIFVSSELEELTQVCDRVLVLRDGMIREEVPGTEASSDRLLALAMKGKEGHLA